MKELNITIGPKGEVKVEVEGVSGSSCERLTEGLLEKLGATDKKVELKDEYYQAEGNKDYVFN